MSLTKSFLRLVVDVGTQSNHGVFLPVCLQGSHSVRPAFDGLSPCAVDQGLTLGVRVPYVGGGMGEFPPDPRRSFCLLLTFFWKKEDCSLKEHFMLI